MATGKVNRPKYAKLLYDGDPITAINLDLQRYPILIFHTGDKLVFTVVQSGIAGEKINVLSAYNYPVDSPTLVVYMSYAFRINSDATGIYIDQANTVQRNVNITTGAVEYSKIGNLAENAYFDKVYGIEV